ncbi:MAG: toxin Bro [Phascolarctobacterium sp.]|nr:MAG: toxin Bro [Phascolarctobacterium sp.]
MSNELQIFKNADFGEIRTVVKNNEIMFVAADVCKALDLTNSRKAVSRLDDDEKGVTLSDTPGGKQNLTVVNEYGLYNLVLSSRKPEAKAFKRWITHEVIPAIRKTGTYSKALPQWKEKEIEARLNNSRARIASELRKIAEKTDIPEYKHICQQKAAEVLSGVPLLPMEEAKEVTYSATDIGKTLGVSAMKIGQIANQYNLKTPQYGKYFYSKSEHSCKEVETFRYYECAISKFAEILEGRQ